MSKKIVEVLVAVIFVEAVISTAESMANRGRRIYKAIKKNSSKKEGA